MATMMLRFILLATLLSGKVSGFQMDPRRLRLGVNNPRAGNVPASSSRLFTPRRASTSGEKLTDPNLAKWDPTTWTAKRLHNTPLFRSAAILATLAVAGISSNAPLARISTQAGATVHLLSFATWFGTVVYTTFIAGITMFQNLERRTFGKLQSKLFPKYFSLCSVTILLQILTLRNLPSLGQRATTALGSALSMTLLNQFILEPKSTYVMFKRYEMEDKPDDKESDEYKKLAASFGKFHGMSSLSNLIALCAAVAHGYYLSVALVPTTM